MSPLPHPMYICAAAFYYANAMGKCVLSCFRVVAIIQRYIKCRNCSRTLHANIIFFRSHSALLVLCSPCAREWSENTKFVLYITMWNLWIILIQYIWNYKKPFWYVVILWVLWYLPTYAEISEVVDVTQLSFDNIRHITDKKTSR